MSVRPDVLSRLGLWPVALVLGVVVAARLGAIVFAPEPPRRRVLGGALLFLALVVGAVRLLGAVGMLSTTTLFVPLVLAGFALARTRRERTLGLGLVDALTRETWPLLAVAAAGVVVAAVVAWLLPVWQWDSLGYHLPYVNFALQRGTLADEPVDVPFLSTYPHDIEYAFVAWRAMLADDRLVDAAQIPFGLLGAVACAALAREVSARPSAAIAAGLAWLALPAVFLQLPTNYIDVACAALLLAAASFVLAPPTSRTVLAAGLALGLFLGAKPNAPVGTALLLVPLAWRAWRGGERRALGVALVLVLALGAESYLTNLVRHHNPIWPIVVKVGPISLPGTMPMQMLLDSGAAAPRLHGFVIGRMLRSWLSLDAPPVFDMRYGGLGLAFLLALPGAVLTAVRRRDVALAFVVLATLASPDPAVPRYVLAFPGLVLALAAAALPRPEPARRLVLGVVALGAALGLWRAYPGLLGEGPPLAAYLRMTPAERDRAVGADGPAADFLDALAALRPGEGTAFDNSFHLPYLAWPGDLSRAALRIPDDVDPASAARLVADPSVRLFIVDPRSPVAEAARSRGGEFHELFSCKSSSCIVLLRS